MHGRLGGGLGELGPHSTSREGFCEVKAAAHRVQEGDVEGERDGMDFGEGHPARAKHRSEIIEGPPLRELLFVTLKQ